MSRGTMPNYISRYSFAMASSQKLWPRWWNPYRFSGNWAQATSQCSSALFQRRVLMVLVSPRSFWGGYRSGPQMSQWSPKQEKSVIRVSVGYRFMRTFWAPSALENWLLAGIRLPIDFPRVDSSCKHMLFVTQPHAIALGPIY